jgi:NADPH:quinone reductase-like Zn-dependent oxidoreductase
VQGEILDRLATLVDQGAIRTTLGQTLSPINAANLERAHTLLASGRTIGKIALQDWG